jgi:hypothetical protein
MPPANPGGIAQHPNQGGNQRNHGKQPTRKQQFKKDIVAMETRLRNPNALRRKGMRACQAFHYPQKMGFLPYARTIFEAQAAFLPHATNI